MMVQIMRPFCPQNYNKADNPPMVIHNTRAFTIYKKISPVPVGVSEADTDETHTSHT